MTQKLQLLSKRSLYILAGLTVVMLVAFMLKDTAFAQDSPQDTACGVIESLTSAQCEGADTEVGEQKVSDIAKPIVNILSAVAGAVAVIFLVIGGIKYGTSGGSPEKIKSAKGTILAALIGFAIIIATQFILNIAIGFTEEVTSDVAPATDGGPAAGESGT